MNDNTTHQRGLTPSKAEHEEVQVELIVGILIFLIFAGVFIYLWAKTGSALLAGFIMLMIIAIIRYPMYFLLALLLGIGLSAFGGEDCE